MPSRRRHRQSTAESPSPGASVDPVSQFGRLLRESAEREAAASARAERQRADATARRRAAEEHAESLRAAQRELERAIAAVRRAHADRRGEAEADTAWRTAKARVIELETGAPPGWATESSEDATPGKARPQPPAGRPAVQT